MSIVQQALPDTGAAPIAAVVAQEPILVAGQKLTPQTAKLFTASVTKDSKVLVAPTASAYGTIEVTFTDASKNTASAEVPFVTFVANGFKTKRKDQVKAITDILNGRGFIVPAKGHALSPKKGVAIAMLATVPLTNLVGIASVMDMSEKDFKMEKLAQTDTTAKGKAAADKMQKRVEAWMKSWQTGSKKYFKEMKPSLEARKTLVSEWVPAMDAETLAFVDILAKHVEVPPAPKEKKASEKKSKFGFGFGFGADEEDEEGGMSSGAIATIVILVFIVVIMAAYSFVTKKNPLSLLSKMGIPFLPM